jgi:uncharacterized protein with von Willebrand factor type A (vWA) domain
MKYEYGKFDGQNFPSPDDLFPTQQVVEFILQYGQQALDAMQNFEDDQEQQIVGQLLDAGLLEKDESDGTLRLTPRMVRGIQHRSLLDIFQGLRTGTREGHPTFDPGRSDERTEGVKPYVFGDKLSELDLGTTLRHAVHRASSQSGPTNARSHLPIHLHTDDFELHQMEGQSDLAMCMLIDMSGSMMRWGRFYQAKRVALGMAEMIRTRFPQDTIDFVGFYSLANVIPERELPLVMPKPISVRDFQVRVGVPLEQARANPELVPQHFTNLQLGLRLARQTLSRRGAANKVIFIITDGQPTAHVEPGSGPGGDESLHLLYPPSERTSTITLKEALRCQQQGIRLATFALIEDYWGMDWVGFVDQLTRLTRGIAYYCSSDDLSATVIESYLSGKKRKSIAGY